jgi:phosphoenolpyruvate carboxykinase (GTP)
VEAWRAEIPDIEKHFAKFGDRLPERLKKQFEALKERLK